VIGLRNKRSGKESRRVGVGSRRSGGSGQASGNRRRNGQIFLLEMKSGEKLCSR